jgi:hypothetical protein
MREAILIIATGVKGVGKSYTTLWKEIIPFARGLKTGKRRPVLIFDVNNEYAWTSDIKSNIYPKAPEDKKLTNGRPIKILAIALKDVVKLSRDTTGMIRRFAPFYTEDRFDKKGIRIPGKGKGELMKREDLQIALAEILRIFHNGLLLVEDLRRLYGNSVPRDISDAITSNRHKNLDVIWHLQSVGRILPEYWENVNYVRFHKEANSIDNARDKLPDENLFMIAEYMLNAEYAMGNTRHYIYVDNIHHDLRGNYSRESMLSAIDAYLKRNRRLFNNLMGERDDNNKPTYTQASAKMQCKKEMFEKYYGNGKKE